jgi:hypothetical protein
VAARVIVAVVAVAVIGWLAVMERDTRVLDDGRDAAGAMVTSGRSTPEQVAGAESDFRDARFLNPDTSPDVHRAVLYATHGREDEAADLMEDLVRREPENLSAWGVLVAVTRESDPATSRRAAAARRRLDPLGASR